MGCFCSCFGFPEVEESSDVIISDNQNCAPFGHLIQIFKNKYGVVSSNPGIQTMSSYAQETDIATTEVGTNTFQGTLLRNSSSSRNLDLKRYVAVQGNGVGSAPLQLENGPREGRDVQVNMCSKSKDIAGTILKENKDEACRFASPVNVSSEKVETEHKENFYSTRDEVECPTCLEEYTDENPKITSKCNHHFHLGCIYEWMERSSTCPMCFEEMKFAENI